MTAWVLIVFVKLGVGVGLTTIPDLPTQEACKAMAAQITEAWGRSFNNVEYLCIQKPQSVDSMPFPKTNTKSMTYVQ